MENSFGPLIESIEQYSKTSVEIVKLRSVEKLSDLFATLISQFLLIIFAALFILILCIGLSYWLGDIVGKLYYGFIIVSSILGIALFSLFLAIPTLKKKINNSIIKQMLS